MVLAKSVRVCTALAVFVAVPVAAQQPQQHGEHAAPEKLGQVRFTTSCKGVQAEFDRAVALLHSFSFSTANRAFQDVLAKDPACAMAYWGQAMSVWYQIWSPPRPAALKQGLEAVERAQKLGGKTPRDRDLIAAAATFFQDHETKDHRTRSVAYEATMAGLRAEPERYGRRALLRAGVAGERRSP